MPMLSLCLPKRRFTMAVLRVEKNKGYTVMSNHHLKNKELSLKSKGLLSIILSLPDEWDYSTRGLAAICKEGVECIGNTLKELEAAGYVIRNRLRDDKGRITDTEYVIYEVPVNKPTNNREDIYPCTENPYVDNTRSGSQHNASERVAPIDTAEVIHNGISPRTGNPYMDNPYTDKPNTVMPYTENQSQYNTKTIKDIKELNTNTSNTHQSITVATAIPVDKSVHSPVQNPIDEMDRYMRLIMSNIEYSILIQKYDYRRVDEIVRLMFDTVCSTRDTIRIGGDDMPANIVKSRLLKLDSSHIEYVFECLDKNTTKVGNIKAYLLTTLYNAPVTIDAYYRAEVNHDMFG